MSRSQVIVSLIAVPLLVLLVACGGDKKDSSSSNDGGSTSNSANSGSGSSGGATTSNDGALSLENCKAYASMEAAATQAFGGSTFKLDTKALDNLVKASPSEIRGDMTLVVGTIVEVFQGFEKLGVNFNNPSSLATLDAAKLAEFEKLGAKFDDKKFTDASERIEKYFVSKCS